jgi:cytochrome c-type biogenesis protein
MTLEEFLRHVGEGHGFLVALGVSLLGGLVSSAVCPCTLPVGLGMASVAGASELQARRQGLRVAAAFFAGIVINLAVLGTIAGRLGALTTEAFGRYWALAMALLALVAAVVAFRGLGLQVDRLEALRRPGIVGAFGYGFVFSLGTSVAPLVLLLTVSAASGRPQSGLPLAFMFGLGRGLPFLVAGLVGGVAMRFARLGRWSLAIEVTSGGILLGVGVYYARTFAALL